MSKKSITIGTKVRPDYANSNAPYLKHPSNKNLGIGTVTGRWSNTSFVVNFPSRGDLVMNPADMIVASPAPKGYRHPNSPTLSKVEKFTHSLHGSGIDYDWHIDETKSSFRARNAFHTMDGNGFYDAIIDFTVIFSKHVSMGDFKLQFGTGTDYQVKKHMLRDYLEETIAYTLDKLNLR